MRPALTLHTSDFLDLVICLSGYPFAFCEVSWDLPISWSVLFRHMTPRIQALYMCTFVRFGNGKLVNPAFPFIRHNNWSPQKLRVEGLSYDLCVKHSFYSNIESLVSLSLEERNAGETISSSADLNAVGWEWGAQGNEKSSWQELCWLIISLICFSHTTQVLGSCFFVPWNIWAAYNRGPVLVAACTLHQERAQVLPRLPSFHD